MKFWTLVISFLLMFSLVNLTADIFEINGKLGRGMNMGNMLEAPQEGGWGVTLEDYYFKMLKEKGFNSVRIPIRWSAEGRVGIKKPYKINKVFLKRLDRAINIAQGQGLSVIINCHHYEDLFSDYENHKDRFKAIWTQLSEHYKSYPDSLVFEILNEPHGDITPEKWNELQSEILSIIRKSNPTRAVMIGTAEWGSVAALRALRFPADEKNVILTIHYYNPFEFTHQGAEWVNLQNSYGVPWDGDYFDKARILGEMEVIAAFSVKNNVPVNIGEFGAYGKAEINARSRWTSYCARLFEDFGFSWHYWEFASGFGVYDPSVGEWRKPLLDALTSSDKTVLELGNPPTFAAIPAKDLISKADVKPGTAGWKIEGEWLSRPGIALKAGKTYQIIFDVSANQERVASFLVESVDKTKTFAVLKDFKVQTIPDTKILQFRMAESVSDAKMSLNVGKGPIDLEVKNFRLIELGK